MAKVNLVEQSAQLTLVELVKFQLITHCYLKNITVSNADLDSLVLLAVTGETDLSEFCNLVSTKSIFKSNQTVRNSLVRMEKFGFIVKGGISKKRTTIKISPGLNIFTSGNILLNYKFLSLGT